jgi:hypothetical protein
MLARIAYRMWQRCLSRQSQPATATLHDDVEIAAGTSEGIDAREVAPHLIACAPLTPDERQVITTIYVRGGSRDDAVLDLYGIIDARHRARVRHIIFSAMVKLRSTARKLDRRERDGD